MGLETTDQHAAAPGLRPARKGVGGRPKKADPRTRQCNIRLTPREKELVLRRAMMLGQTEAEFARAALLAGSPLVRRALDLPTRSPEERELDEELRRMGVNLNQLVRHINTHPDRPLPADLQPLLATIRRHLAAVLPHDDHCHLCRGQRSRRTRLCRGLPALERSARGDDRAEIRNFGEVCARAEPC